MVERQTEQLQTLSFQLTPITELHKPITIHYQFHNTNKPTEPSKLKPTAALPIFNCDKLFFTPTFILNLDQNYYRVNQAYQGQKFEQRIKESSQQISNKELNLPQPSQNFCQICRSEFENYHQHIKSRFHLNFLGAAKGNKWINEVCRFFKKRPSSKQKKVNEKQLLNQTLHTCKVKKKAKDKNKVSINKNHNYSRNFYDEQIRLPLSTQISFERE